MKEFLNSLKVVTLRKLCDFYEITSSNKKSDLVAALCKANLEIGEIQEVLEEFETARLKETEARDLDLEREKRAHELELARLNRPHSEPVNIVNTAPEKGYDISKFLQPFREDGDIGLFLVNFERVCSQMGFNKETWSLRLMTVLPASAAEVVARLDDDESRNYESAKLCLLKRYRLTSEQFRGKFRKDKKIPGEAFSEYAYRMEANFDQWLKAEKVGNDFAKLKQLLALEQFYSTLTDELRFWVEDRNRSKTLREAADLADEYVSKRGRKSEPSESRPPKTAFRGYQNENKWNKWKNGEDQNKKNPSGTNTEKKGADKPTEPVTGAREKLFEKRKPLQCYNCKGPHYASQCDKPRVAFACLERCNETDRLLEPYLLDAQINGKEGKILRDSAATYDVISADWVTDEAYTGKTVYLRAALSDEHVSLPVAKIKLVGSFGTVETEAAVTKRLPTGYPYLLSNRTWEKINSADLGEPHVIQALTRSMAKKIQEQSPPVTVNKTDGVVICGEGEQRGALSPMEVKASKGENDPVDLEGKSLTGEINEKEKGKSTPESSETESDADDLKESYETLCSGDYKLPPSDVKLTNLISVTPDKLIALQKGDEGLKPFFENSEKTDGAIFYTKGGILYRQWSDKNGTLYEQIVVPTALRANLLHVAHSNGWAGHLGVNKTIARVKQEFWWPQMAKQIKIKIKCCDVCMRVGKPNEKGKEPMRTVPIISEPYSRVILDVVGPMPETKRGNKYLLTVLCSATKFVEAVPMVAANSETIVNALLHIFSRVGFPREVQTDLGSVFVSSLTNTFFESCGIKIIHSSVAHPQSNSVERYHSSIKRIFRALCYENKRDWEECIPAALFSLRSSPNETTGFSPAELLYGRQIRGPMTVIRESWEGTSGVHPTVVEYILTLLDRFQNMKYLVQQNTLETQTRSKGYYDKRARHREFKEGDKVLVLKPVRTNKLQVHWYGPEVVLKRVSDTNYIVERQTGKRKQTIVHVNLLKPYYEESQFTAMTMLPLGEDDAQIDIPELSLAHDEQLTAQTVLERSQGTEKLEEWQKAQLIELISEFPSLFSDKPGSTNLITHDIELKEEKIISSKDYHHSPRVRDLIDKEIDNMIELGRIRPSDSPYSSPLILVEAEGKQPRPVVDYRGLNSITVSRDYPIPHIEQCVEEVSQAKYLSILDLVRGYWQVPMTDRASKYSAFITHRGKYEPIYMNFGLRNAPFSFQKLMDHVLKGLEKFAKPYQDDICVFSNTWEDHLKHLRLVFERLLSASLTVKPSKCAWGQAEVVYLGHVIGQNFRKPAEAKIAAVRNFSTPKSKRDIRSFLGLTGYYNHYIRNYSQIASPLTDALRKTSSNQLKWDGEMEKSFNQLKDELVGGKVLRAPDYSLPFIVQVDCSQRGMGVTLSQVDRNNEEHPVIYLSKKLTAREQSYGASELECACLVWAVGRLKPYLFGSHFIVETDHNPLRWLNNMSGKNGRLLRWSLTLQPLNFTIRYKKGSTHKNVDALSRYFP